MNIFHVYTLLAIFVLQMGVALAEESDALPWSGKPNTKANRKNSRGGSSTDHSHHSHHTHHTHHTHHSKSSKSTDSPFTAVIMNIFHVYTLLAIFVFQMGVALAEGPDPLPWSGKPNAEASMKDSRGGSSHTHHTHHTHHSKSSKSTDSPTLFPTLAPSMSPTYCGKASKSWWNSDRRLSSKSESCHSGSRSAKERKRKLADKRKLVDLGHELKSESCHSGSRSAKERKRKLADKRKLVDLGHEKPDEDAEFELDDMKVRRRRRINSDNREHVDEMKP
eukprot:CAMPEP_0201903582 /NCGR_PEP_ID=MMETSP0902-20130614/55551_1 /ASSEMBLY_ACC=CAM_ASM_000551 /TAXON_ID=420261 /ORGANISM="Thalassiosira antarctica, Strain CCMP982" /LENGTH=277 /DNA_ID=CAMNT_0048437635 /DNA_START=286 /DNA_END=1120 /DNA_ORIENTATION=-